MSFVSLYRIIKVHHIYWELKSSNKNLCSTKNKKKTNQIQWKIVEKDRKRSTTLRLQVKANKIQQLFDGDKDF